MNIDPQSNKSDEIFNTKGLVRPPPVPPTPPLQEKKMTLVSPREKSGPSAKF